MVSADDERAAGLKVLSGKESNVLPLPKYSGDPATFEIFKWQFLRYFEFVDANRTNKYTEKEKLIILERALPDREKRRLIHAQKLGNIGSCQQFLRDMETLLATANESKSLKKWNELSFRFGGRITPDDLMNFETDFECLRYALPHLTEGECQRHLMSKLAPQLATYVHEEEARLHLSQPQILVKMPNEYPQEEKFRKAMQAFFERPILKMHKTPDKRGE